MASFKKTLVAPLLLLALLLAVAEAQYYDVNYEVEDDFEEHGSYAADDVYDVDPEYDDVDAYDEEFIMAADALPRGLPGRQLQTAAVKAVCQSMASKKKVASEAACLQQCGTATTSNDVEVAYRAVDACLLKGVLGGLAAEKPKKTKSTKPAKPAKPAKSKSTKPGQGGKKQTAPGQEKGGRKRAGAFSAGTDGFQRLDVYDVEVDFEDEFEDDLDTPRRQLQTAAVKAVCQSLASKKKVKSEAACLQQCGTATTSNDVEVAYRAVDACLLKDVLGGLSAEKPKKTKSTKPAKPAKPAKSKSTKPGQGGKKASGQEKGGRKRAGAVSAGTDGFQRLDVYDVEDDFEDVFEDEFDTPRRQLQTEAVKVVCQHLASKKRVASEAACLQQCGKATASNDAEVALRAVEACLLKGVLGGLEPGAEKPKKTKSTKPAKAAKPAKSKSTKPGQGGKKQKAPGQEKGGRKRAGAFSAGTDGVQRFDSYEGYDEFDYED